MITIGKFEEYFAAFNARQYDIFPQFYTDDVIYVMDQNNGKVFHGRKTIADLYRTLHQYFDEEVAIDNIAITDRLIAVEVPTLLHCKKAFDLPGFVPIAEGQTCKMMCFNHYDLAPDGKFKRIRVAIQAVEYIDTQSRH